MSKYKMMVVALLPVVALSVVACQGDSLQDLREVQEKSYTVGDTPTS